MKLRRPGTSPELLPDVDPEQDCQELPLVTVGQPSDKHTSDDDQAHGDSHDHDITWETVADPTAVSAPTTQLATWLHGRGRWSIGLERASLVVEQAINRLTGVPHLNPLYHTGPIATFLLLLVFLSGIYLFFFFQYGYEASYQSVVRMENQFIGRTMRGIHRYASGALVITTLLHAFRMLVWEHFRGPRWLAWVTGLLMTAVIWLAGVTGYWLLWDERAQLLTDRFVHFLDSFSDWGTRLLLFMVQAETADQSWAVLLIIFAAHLLLSVLIGLFFWLHIKRLSRPRWVPELPWLVGMGLVLLLGAIIVPTGVLPPATFTQLPGPHDLDPIFLFFLPLAAGWETAVVWGGLLLLGGLLLALPWLGSRQQKPPPVHIFKDRCTGCTKCALDCPYQAIQMVERQDGKRHKYIAIEDPSLCTSCGICVGSCDGLALSLGPSAPEMMWEAVSAQLLLAQAKGDSVWLLFTCERHARVGKPAADLAGQAATELVVLPCVGSVPPGLLTRALDAGVASIQVVGCPPHDCLNREGNLWTEQRLTRQRVPRLKRAYTQAPITAEWVAPDQFGQAVTEPPPPADNGEPDYLSRRAMDVDIPRRGLLVGLVLLLLVMLLQIGLTRLPWTPHTGETAVLQLLVPDLAQPLRGHQSALPDMAGSLEVWINGRLSQQQPITTQALHDASRTPYYQAFDLPPGDYHLHLILTVPERRATYTLFEQPISLAPNQILRLDHQPRLNGFCVNQICGY